MNTKISACSAALQAFDECCKTHGLRYCVLEQLAMPWDDAALEEAPWMAGLPRADYDALTKILKLRPDREGLKAGCTAFEITGPDGQTGRIELYPLDALSDDYETFNASLDKALRTFRKCRTEADFAKMQEERRSMAAKTGHLAGPDQTRRVYTVYQNRQRIFRRKDLFPARRCFAGEDRTFAFYAPADALLWHKKDDPAYLERLAVQCTSLLRRLDVFCRKMNIPYFPVGDLLAGMVFYGKQVPSESEHPYEIGMLRPHYERFLNRMQNYCAEAQRHGKRPALQLNEYADDQGKYPLETRTVSFWQEADSDAVIRILPYDRIPDDTYLRAGFLEEMERQNRRVHMLLRSHSYRGPINHTLKRNPLTRLMKGEKQAWQMTVGWEKPGQLEQVRSAAAETCYCFTASAQAEVRKTHALAAMFWKRPFAGSYGRVAFQKSRMFKEDQLFPQRHRMFRGIELPCPNDPGAFISMPYKGLEEERACLQEADLVVLKEFDRVCSKLQIGYFVCGGTLLGYARHRGFIPWDDDVDVAMLRADYDRFLQEAPAELKKGFFLQTRKSDPYIPYVYSKLRMEGTEYITEYVQHRRMHRGIGLDLFPFDYLPDVPEKCSDFIREVKEYAKAHMQRAACLLPIPGRPDTWPEGEEEDAFAPEIWDAENDTDPIEREALNGKERRWLSQQRMKREKYWEEGLEKSQECYIRAATRYNASAKEKGYTVVASFMPTFTWISLEDLLPYGRGEFAGLPVSVPKRPEVFLTMQYGDFRKLPPLHKQFSHRLVRWKTWEQASSCADGDSMV